MASSISLPSTVPLIDLPKCKQQVSSTVPLIGLTKCKRMISTQTTKSCLFARGTMMGHPSIQVCYEGDPSGPRCGCLTSSPCPDFRKKDLSVPTTESKIPVVVVMGATGTGKSKLAIDIANRFAGEIINSTDMQVYEGLDMLTNKVTPKERELVPHHLIGVVGDPDADFTADDFRHAAAASIADVAARCKLPVVAGGSCSYIEALVDDPAGEFRSKHEICFLCIDVDMHVLLSSVSGRVHEMVNGGLVEEVRALYRPGADYTVGVRRSIGVAELDKYFRKEKVLASAIDEMTVNACKLACFQVEKICEIAKKPGWNIHALAATAALSAPGEEKAAAWRSNVAGPAMAIVARFLAGGVL